jgi:hypothetical protein
MKQKIALIMLGIIILFISLASAYIITSQKNVRLSPAQDCGWAELNQEYALPIRPSGWDPTHTGDYSIQVPPNITYKNAQVISASFTGVCGGNHEWGGGRTKNCTYFMNGINCGNVPYVPRTDTDNSTDPITIPLDPYYRLVTLPEKCLNTIHEGENTVTFAVTGGYEAFFLIEEFRVQMLVEPYC